MTRSEAAAVLGLGPDSVSRLAAGGVLRGVRRGSRLWVRADDVRAEADRRHEWVSWVEASRIIGCNPRTVGRLVADGHVVRRRGLGRGTPSLRRDSVIKAAGEWTAAQTENSRKAEQTRLDREARRSVPPQDGRVWLDTATTAILLGVSTARVRQLATQGRLPFTVAGQRRWYLREQIEQIAAGRVLRRRMTRVTATPQGRVLGQQALLLPPPR